MHRQTRSTGRNKPVSALRAIACAAALVVAAAGCGADEAASGDEGAEAAAGGDLGTLKVMHTQAWNLTQMGTDAGIDQDVWENLEVEQVIGQDVAQGLATGDVDISIDSPNRFIPAMLDGLDAKIVGPTITAFDVYIIVPPDSPVQELADLKGESIGVTSFGSSGEFAVRKMAESLGWSESDYDIVPLGTPAAELAAMTTGTIAAMPWSAGGAYTAQAQGKARVVGSVADLVGPAPVATIQVAGSVLRDRPEAVKEFCRGFYEMQSRMQKDDALTKDLLTRGAEYPPEVADELIEVAVPLLATSPEMNDGLIAGMAEATRVTTPEGPGHTVTEEQVKDMTQPCDEL